MKKSWKSLEKRKIGTLKTSWRRLQDILWRRLGDQQNIYWQGDYMSVFSKSYLHLANLYLANMYLLIKKKLVAQETIDLNISWPCNFFEKYFITLPINFSFLFKALLWQYFRVVLTVIFKFQITKEVNFDHNIQNIFWHIKFL